MRMGLSSHGLRCVRASGVDEFHIDFRWFKAVDDRRVILDEGDVSPLEQLAHRVCLMEKLRTILVMERLYQTERTIAS